MGACGCDMRSYRANENNYPHHWHQPKHGNKQNTAQAAMHLACANSAVAGSSPEPPTTFLGDQACIFFFTSSPFFPVSVAICFSVFLIVSISVSVCLSHSPDLFVSQSLPQSPFLAMSSVSGVGLTRCHVYLLSIPSRICCCRCLCLHHFL